MAPPTDPTRRLRLLTTRSARMQERGGGLADHSARRLGGWVPTWPADDQLLSEPGDHRANRQGDDEAVGDTESDRDWPVGDDEPADEPGNEPADEPGEEPGEPVAGRRRLRLPAFPTFPRLRQRWIPESLREARVDPGRSGSLVLSALALIAALVAAVGVWLARPTPQLLPAVNVSAAIEQTTSGAAAAPKSVQSSAPSIIVVSVTGAVRQPGVVTLSAGARVADAIAAAGGLDDGVDLTGLNLAARLADGDSVVVGGAHPGVQVQPGDAGPSPAAGSAAPLINLNTADSVALQSLPGVGPVMASNIIAWRDANGPFTTIDQLQEVTGIGPTRFATLAPLVSLQ